jgi:hypothetical protein
MDLISGFLFAAYVDGFLLAQECFSVYKGIPLWIPACAGMLPAQE